MAGKLWTDEGVARLIRLWDSGMPVVKMSETMEITEASITGKVHRLHLTKRQSTVPKRVTSTAPAREPKDYPGRYRVPVVTLAPLPSDSLSIDTSPVAVSSLRRRPQEIGECCFPVTQGRPWRFCCAATLPGGNYCQEHARITSEEKKSADATVQEASADPWEPAQGRSPCGVSPTHPLATNLRSMVSSNGKATSSRKNPHENTIRLAAVA